MTQSIVPILGEQNFYPRPIQEKISMAIQNQEIAVETHKNQSAIQGWLVSYIAQLLEIDPKEVDVKASFDRYGLDSSATIGLTSDLENWLGGSIDPTITYDYPSIESLSKHLAGS